jgi:AAA+ ATPase superfamily predicted ATPase
MSQHRPVPRLDLAPKLKRPLSLWNPLDYLRLLYWVFFFPQALRWYVDTFGGGYIREEEMNWRKGLELLRQNAIQRQLLLQGLVLTVIIPLALCRLLEQIGLEINWAGVAFGVAGGVAFGVAGGVADGVAFGVAGGVAFGVAFGVAVGVANGVGVSVAVGVAFGVAVVVANGMANGVAYGVAYGMANGVVFGVTNGVANGVAFGVAVAVAFGVAVAVAILRPESWLIGLPFNLRSLQNGSWLLPRITPLPLPYLAFRLHNWLQQDWETGLHNTNQLWEYTLQFIPVVQAVNRVLAKTSSEQMIWRVSRLAGTPFDWQLVYIASASFLGKDTRLDTPARAAAAGFWHLHKKEPAKAMEAFAVVRSLPNGEEMFTLAQTLTAFHDAKELATIIALQVPAFPKEPLLRSTTWETLTSLRRVVEDVQVVQRSVSRSARAFALNRALGELLNILCKADSLPEAERKLIRKLIVNIDNGETLPKAEQELIVDIALNWSKALLQVAAEVGKISITKPVSNPYVVGDPVQGNLFVGREDVLRQLEEFWVMGHQLQSVVLYGHRRMGKTSILRNVANCLGSEVKIAYINLLNMGATSQGVGEVLMAISDAISDAVSCTPPADADLLNLPYRTFERYLKQVEAHLSGGLIVALDEFEKIEELIEAEKIPKDFMGYLRGLVQMSSKVAFAFAGLHTLEEMTADYFQPFFASVIPIHVGFLQPGATRQILANPDEEFPLDYTPEALDQIYALTAGQPYLVQLVGFQLVRRYNDYVFEQGRPRDPVFTVEDVEAVINNPEFFKQGSGYFTGVWGQAARGAFGQQAILKVLASHPEGLNIYALVQATGMEEKTLQEALKTLKRHDVVEEREGCWQIIVELFRRWVLQP